MLESRTLGRDPGDLALLQLAATDQRILVTIDTDFGKLIFVDKSSHCGIVRLPDVPADRRIQLLKDVLQRHAEELEAGAIVTIRRGVMRISKLAAPPS